MAQTLAVLEAQTFENEDYAEVPPSDIVAYNELRSCADLFRMHEQGMLEIQPDFQRDVVWRGPEQTRFINSLIKQLPIPSMCFANGSQIAALDRDRWLAADIDDCEVSQGQRLDPIPAG